MKTVFYTGKAIHIDNSYIELEYPIRDAYVVDDKVIVMYDPDAETEKFSQFQNIVAYSLDPELGWNLSWRAELPTTTSGDRYYRILSKDPLIATSFSSFKCRIDLSNGRIAEKVFLK